MLLPVDVERQRGLAPGVHRLRPAGARATVVTTARQRATSAGPPTRAAVSLNPNMVEEIRRLVSSDSIRQHAVTLNGLEYLDIERTEALRGDNPEMTQPLAQTALAAPSLLASFTEPQQAVFDVLKESFPTGGPQFPVYGYVERMLDRQGYLLEEILPTFPAIGVSMMGGGLYKAVWSSGSEQDTPMGLTMAGLAHLPTENQPVLNVFLATLREMARHRDTAPLDPLKVEDPTVTSMDLAAQMHQRGNNWLGWLPNLMRHEPPTWSGEVQFDEVELTWTWRCTRSLRHFIGVEGVADYLTRVAAYLAPSIPQSVAQETPPPLDLAAALDFLDTVWQLTHSGDRLVLLPSAALVQGLAQGAQTSSEFDARLSALGQVLKGLNVRPVKGVHRHPVQWLGAQLREELPAEAHNRIDRAVEALEAIVHVRNAMQHTQAEARSVAALQTLGLQYPVTAWDSAWRTIRERAAAAMWSLREELQGHWNRPMS